ncbi:MAG: NUDIX domain-containing protein [Candidatus Peribacteraceae bacterium]|nr:NUDIX domain-containing protein [Candidatus Peribacteraceae bacterium]
MEELLDVYDLQDRLIGVEERSKFYREIEAEFKAKRKITKKVKTIRVLLMNSQGRVYVQKRSLIKMHNAGLYDKTIGGHILHGHTVHVTLVKECAEELGIPAVMLPDDEFARAVTSTNLGIIGIFKKTELVTHYPSVRKTKEEDILQPFINTFIIGYYDGAIRFCDGESSGIEVFGLPELRDAILKNPERYTDDLRHFIEKYQQHIIPVKKIKIPPAEV